MNGAMEGAQPTLGPTMAGPIAGQAMQEREQAGCGGWPHGSGGGAA
jgi:hypothetical protein